MAFSISTFRLLTLGTVMAISVLLSTPAMALTDLEMKRYSQMRKSLLHAAEAVKQCNKDSPEMYLDFLVNYGRASKPLTTNDVAKNDMRFNETELGQCHVTFDVVVNTTPQKTHIKGDCTYGQEYIETLKEAASSIDFEMLQNEPEQVRQEIQMTSSMLSQFATMNCREYETGTR